MTTPQKKKMMFAIGLLLVSGLLLLLGCSLFEEEKHDSPTTPALEAVNATYGKESGIPASYQPGSEPGIEILANFCGFKDA